MRRWRSTLRPTLSSSTYIGCNRHNFRDARRAARDLSNPRKQVTAIWQRSGSAVLRAADAAARWHVYQQRKGAAEEPYVNHLLEVATLVAEATEGKGPELVVAALLHDSIGEDD